MKSKKLKSEYECGDLPEPCITSCDIESAINATEEQALDLFIYLAKCDAGEVFTQVDKVPPSDSKSPDEDIFYVRGVHVVNRTGVYAFCFGRFSPEKVGGKGKTGRKNADKTGC